MKKKFTQCIVFSGLIFIFTVYLTGCLKTRSDVSEQKQSAVYGKKNAANQMEAQTAIVIPNENDELIRNLNGRVEVLENQISILQQAKLDSGSQEAQKILLLQEALTKMESQIQKLESSILAELQDNKLDLNSAKNSDDLGRVNSSAKNKKNDSYEVAEQHFAKSEWKKAIVNFQKYTDESPRGKHVAEAKYKIGQSFQELGMKEEAMAFYEEVVANYAKTDVGKKSKTLLAKLMAKLKK